MPGAVLTRGLLPGPAALGEDGPLPAPRDVEHQHRRGVARRPAPHPWFRAHFATLMLTPELAEPRKDNIAEGLAAAGVRRYEGTKPPFCTGHKYPVPTGIRHMNETGVRK